MAYTFQGKGYLLTGASSGIGEELAWQLAEQGARLVLASRDTGKLGTVAARCQELGAEATVIQTDVSHEDQCRTLVSQAVEELQGLDGVILNAGVSMWGRFDEMIDATVVRKIMEVNFFGTLYCLQAALPHLITSRGRIAAMASIAALTGAPLHSGYAASKHAISGLLESVRTEIADSGVKITVLYPEFVRTRIRLHGYQADGSHPTSDPYDDSSGMSANKAARLSLKAVRKGKRMELFVPLSKLGYRARPFLPGVIDSIARKKVGLS